jgi:hypothetical protein
VPTLAERVQANATLFRRANAGIAAFAIRFADHERRVPFMCECVDDGCAAIVRMSVHEYGLIELFSNQFAISLACADRGGEGLEIVRTDRFAVVDRLNREP